MGASVRSVVLVMLPSVAVIATDVLALTMLVVIGNVALFEPSAILTVAGILITPEGLAVRDTIAPPAGAVPERMTVPVEKFPPVTVSGASVNHVSSGAVGVSRKA